MAAILYATIGMMDEAFGIVTLPDGLVYCFYSSIHPQACAYIPAYNFSGIHIGHQ